MPYDPLPITYYLLPVFSLLHNQQLSRICCGLFNTKKGDGVSAGTRAALKEKNKISQVFPDIFSALPPAFSFLNISSAYKN
jgi:hypothetical protein